MIQWLQDWYQSQCDGDWEHQYGVCITTIDNPGWYLSIDLIYTPFQDIEIELKNFEKDVTDWFSYKVKEGKYEAFGDPSKLETLILTFKTFLESANVS
jgi:hypothetical protein